MAVSQRGVPNSLKTAFRELITALNQNLPRPMMGRPTIKKKPYKNSRDVCDAIERFVAELIKTPAGTEELQKRASFVERRCGPDSNFATSRAVALKSYRGRRPSLTGCARAMERLNASEGTPTCLVEVLQVRQDIERVLNGKDSKLTDKVRTAYNSWLEAAIKVQRQAEPLEVDGCRHLSDVYSCSLPDPPPTARYAKEVLLSDLGAVNLSPIKAAAESLMEWAKTSIAMQGHADAGKPEKKPGKRGRKKADYMTGVKEASIAREWGKARDAGTAKKDYAMDHHMRLADLDRLLDRVAKRNRPSE